MTTQMTPMKRFSSAINTFRGNVNSYFKEVNLNKSAPKYDPTAWRDDKNSYSKGVENDFIMIFNCKGIEPSFAISFTYIGLPPEQHKVEVSIKKGKDNKSIVTSGEMSLEDFRIKLNEMNKLFNDKAFIKTKSETSILEKVSEVFLKEKYDLTGEIKKATKDIKKLRESKRVEYKIDELEENVILTTKGFESADKKFKKAITTSEESLEVERLEELLKQAKENLKNKTATLKTKYKIEELSKDMNKAKKDLHDKSNQMNNEIDVEINKLPGIVSRRLKP